MEVFQTSHRRDRHRRVRLLPSRARLECRYWAEEAVVTESRRVCVGLITNALFCLASFSFVRTMTFVGVSVTFWHNGFRAMPFLISFTSRNVLVCSNHCFMGSCLFVYPQKCYALTLQVLDKKRWLSRIIAGSSGIILNLAL